MKSAWKVTVVVLATVFAVTAGLSAQSKWVRGAVTAMGPDTITVKAQDKDFTFKVDKATRLVARGASTETRKREDAGKPGPTLADFVKVGQSVEVEYKESGGAMMATEVRPVAGGEGMSAESSGNSYRGTVSMVAADAVTVKGADNQDWKFGIDTKISVVGIGVGTKARQYQEAGKPLVVPELVGAGDTVIVYFAEVGGAKVAKEIRVLEKAR